MILVDLVIVYWSFLLAYAWRLTSDVYYPLSAYSWPFLYLVIIWAACLFYLGMYESFRLKRIRDILLIIYQTFTIGFFLFTAVCYLARTVHVARALTLVTFGLAAIFIAAEKIILIYIFRHFRRKGVNYHNVLIVGTGARAQRLIDSFDENRELGLKVLGILDMEKEKIGQTVHGHRVLGTLNDLPRITKEFIIDQVFFVVPRDWLGQIELAILYLEKLGISSHVAIDHFNVVFARARQSEYFNIPFLTLETTPDDLFQLLIKRLMDIFLSTVALIVLSPIMAITAILVKMTSEGPVFFTQKRVSVNGRIFNLFKFRTMVKDAESRLAQLKNLNEMKGPVFKIDKDPRITPIGDFLRKASIDELPQLWNVLKGDMSLVGPRPPIPSEVSQYNDWHRRRLSMRPGITCLWQVGGRNRITDFDEWAKLDLEYIDHWSLWLDVKILLKTIPVVLLRVGAK
ncbi:MAG: sugar transferase [Candidatus Omnitrophica bacterium]|nr:sugar transferase [Candidatus Omnitrophota bacterium]